MGCPPHLLPRLLLRSLLDSSVFYLGKSLLLCPWPSPFSLSSQGFSCAGSARLYPLFQLLYMMFLCHLKFIKTTADIVSSSCPNPPCAPRSGIIPSLVNVPLTTLTRVTEGWPSVVSAGVTVVPGDGAGTRRSGLVSVRHQGSVEIIQPQRGLPQGTAGPQLTLNSCCLVLASLHTQAPRLPAPSSPTGTDLSSGSFHLLRRVAFRAHAATGTRTHTNTAQNK